MKKFWKRTEGFTLVELIVVIAILGILAGIGTVGYSGYVKKANMAADQQLVSQVANALQLHYYNNPGQNTDGYVVLTPEGEVCTYDDVGVGDAAMVAAFGDGWENALSLKHDGWERASLSGSSFDGKEEKLMDTVNELTGTFADFLKDYDGNADGFFPYLEKIGVDKTDTTAAANAAILYVGNAVKKADQEKISDILTSVPSKIVSQMNEKGQYDSSKIMMETAVALQGEMGGSTLATAALMYAYAESYALATGQTLTIKPENITNGSTGLAEVQRAFTELMDITKTVQAGKMEEMMAWGGITGSLGNYALSEGATYQKDAKAVMSAMDAVNSASALLMDKLDQENLFAEAATRELVTSYLNGVDGSIMIVIQNGKVTPLPDPQKQKCY